MNYSDNFLQFLKNQEAFINPAKRPIPTDPVTYGWGFTTMPDGSPVTEGRQISQEDADARLVQELQPFVNHLTGISPSNLTQNQFDAVLSLIYNIGFELFHRSNTGIMFSNGEDISERFLLYVYSAGKFIQGLQNRRLRERKLYMEGDYQL